MTDLLVIHDLGAVGGAPWRDAFARWRGQVSAPDLPGHGVAPAPVGGHHEVGDAVFALVDEIAAIDLDAPPVIVGVGANGHAARVLALAGRAAGLVLVDGVGGPWLGIAERNAALRRTRRSVLDRPAALAPHVPGRTDVRATLHLPLADREHARTTMSALEVPTLVLETPACPIDDGASLTAVVRHGTHRRVDDDRPATIAAAVYDWWRPLDDLEEQP